MLQSMRSAAKYIWIFLVIFFVGGFLLAETSGLLGRAPVTSSTAVATVNGEDILASSWYAATQQLEQQESQRSGSTVTLEQRDRMSDQAFEQLVSEVLLRQEYKRRGITVTDDEITEAARYNPPPQLAQNPEFQTEGRFDPEKYQRFLASPVARQEGLLLNLEQYYRAEIPKEKLFEQVAAAAYMSDAELWEAWRDVHDSAQVAFVKFGTERIPDAAVMVTNTEISDYYDKNKKDLDRPARAQVSVLVIPRAVTAADSATVHAKLLALRERIAKGEKFEDVAKAESQDTGSAVNGGLLGRGVRGRFVPEFETAAFALKTGELSPPVLTRFGYHLMRVDERKGDTLALRHILLRIQQSDSAAAATDRKADSLAKIAASADDPKKFDVAAQALHLTPVKGVATEGQPLTVNGQLIPSVSSWATKGAKKGEISDLFDSEDGYFLARVDSVVPGGIPTLDAVRGDIRNLLMERKKLDALMPQAELFARAAAVSGLEQAAQSARLQAIKTPMFSRLTAPAEMGRATEAVGAAFSLPLGAVSAAIKTPIGVFVERVDSRNSTSKTVWAAQKETQRLQVLQQLRQTRLREFMTNLREAAKITDRRKDIEAATRRATNQ